MSAERESLARSVAEDAQAIKRVAKGLPISRESADRLLACGLLVPGKRPGMVVLSRDGEAMHRTIMRGGR